MDTRPLGEYSICFGSRFIMFKHYNKDQKLVLLGACLYYMGLGGFIFNSQSTVLAAAFALSKARPHTPVTEK